jgi:hypothetical protein
MGEKAQPGEGAGLDAVVREVAGYRAPVARVLPAAVVVLSVFAACVYGGIKMEVILPTLVLYALGIAYFGLSGRRRIRQAAPEELAARQTGSLASIPFRAPIRSWPETIAAGVILAVLTALVWVVLAAYWPQTFALASTEVEVIVVLALLAAALSLVSAVALLHTRS